MKKVDRLILSVAAGAAVLFYVTKPRRTVPTTAANRAAQARADDARANLWQRELSGTPEFWA